MSLPTLNQEVGAGNTATKRCTKCGEAKALSEFPVVKDKKSTPGKVYSYLHSHCRGCHAERASKWYYANKTRALRKCKEIYERNRSAHLLHAKEWKAKNQEKVRIAKRKYKKAHPECDLKRLHWHIKTLSDYYVRNALRLTVANAPPELIAIKREQLLIHRARKQLKEKANGK